jgi:phosphoenolpyruvate carboxylase
MQTRLLLASWLGAEALAADGEAGRALRAMYREWPFFRSLIELLEMALGQGRRADRGRLRPAARARRSAAVRRVAARPAAGGDERRARHHRAAELLADNDVLRRSIEVRNPYVDPINLFQIELLRRLAAMRGAPPAPGVPGPAPDATQAEAVLRQALRITIGGVAAGMRNTG